MTIEELLIPRCKILVDFPQWSVFKHKKDDILIKKGIHFVGKGTSRSINKNEVDKYPGVIHLLEWWEDRDIKDMPEYIRFGEWNKRHVIYKIIEYNPPLYEHYFPCAIAESKNTKDYFLPTFLNSFPSTKEEYEKTLKNK